MGLRKLTQVLCQDGLEVKGTRFLLLRMEQLSEITGVANPTEPAAAWRRVCRIP